MYCLLINDKWRQVIVNKCEVSMIETAENALPKKYKNQYCAWYIMLNLYNHHATRYAHDMRASSHYFKLLLVDNQTAEIIAIILQNNYLDNLIMINYWLLIYDTIHIHTNDTRYQY